MSKIPFSLFIVLASAISAGTLFSKPSHVQYYGHYWAASKSYGNHMEVYDEYVNVHFVTKEFLPEVKKMKQKAIVEVRWEFQLDGDIGFKVGTIRPDHKVQWNAFRKSIEPYLDCIAAIYVQDEPYWTGLSKEDLEYIVNLIKENYPTIPVMMNYAGKTLIDKTAEECPIPANVDWVGFDHYEDISVVKKLVQVLKERMLPHQRIWLVPQGVFGGGVAMDKDLADLNYQYYELAKSEPLVIGSLVFGPANPHEQADKMVLTKEAQRKIGFEITGKKSKQIDFDFQDE